MKHPFGSTAFGSTLFVIAIVACTGENPAEDGSDAGSGGASMTGGSAGQGQGGVSGTGGTTAGNAGSTVGGSAGTNVGTGGATTGGDAGTAGTVAGMSGASGTSGAATGGDAGTGGGGAGGTAGANGGSTPGGAGAGGTAGSGGTPGGGFVTCPYTPPANPTAQNFTAGMTTLFNNNGAWTWYSDERAIVDVAGGKILVSSDANTMGASGSGRDGTVEVVSYDIASRAVSAPFVLGDLAPDDHNNAAILVKPDGRYLAFWAGHNENCNSYWRNHNGTQWGASQTFNWTSNGCPFENNRSITYNNLWNMTAENKIYNFVRSVGTSPNMLVSSDNGVTWTYGGRLSATPTVGYVAGYYKYWGNQVDRIDFLATEAHPRDNDNSLYHGYIRGGRSYTSMNVEVDANITDANAPQVTGFTRIFATGTMIDGKRMHHAWNSDIVRYADGTIAAIGMARNNTDTSTPTHSFLYFRFNGTSWTTTYLGEAGTKLYSSEEDYVGLGAVHPNDPRIVYISTYLDPRNDMNIGNHEVFMGVTCDNGMTFQWTPITWNSTRDNLRPIVPAWDGNNMVLLWFRGTYQTAQIYAEEVVGIITQR